MNTKMLILVAMAFFAGWKRIHDPLLLFCAVMAAALWVCVLIYRLETTNVVYEEDS